MTALIKKGETAAAVAIYRERTNSGLKEAEDAVNALARGEHLPKPNSVLTTVDQDVVSLVREGKKLDAIKLYRAKTGVGLAEAKQAVTDLANEYGIQSRGSGCLGVLLTFLTMSVLAYWAS